MTMKSNFSFAKSAAESVGRGQSASKKGTEVVLEPGVEAVAAIAARVKHRRTKIRASNPGLVVTILLSVNLHFEQEEESPSK
jgi:hypothetical protein